MRSALIISGRIMTYEQNLHHINYLCQNYNMDIFCAVNHEMDTYHKQFIDDTHPRMHHIQLFTIPPSIQDRIDREPKPLNRNRNVYHVISMFYHRFKCCEMVHSYAKNHNVHYDIILSCRVDIVTKDIHNIIQSAAISDNSLYIPFGEDYDGINDQIAYGNMSSMTKYCNLINHLDSISCSEWDPELMLHEYLAHHLCNPIKIHRYHFQYSLSQYRHIPSVYYSKLIKLGYIKVPINK